MTYVSFMENRGPKGQISVILLIFKLLTLPEMVVSTAVQELSLSGISSKRLDHPCSLFLLWPETLAWYPFSHVLSV